MKCILGKKLGMTQVFRSDGAVVPVTRIQAGPCVVTQRKTKEKDGADAIQLGFGEQKKFRLNRAEQGHLAGLATVRFLKDIRLPAQTGVGEGEAAVKRGDIVTVKTFEPGDRVDVIGWSKGKGFQGVVKRHGFRGGPKTHGHKDNLRMPGTIGAGGVQRVFKNVRMGGHMGDERITVKNLEIIEILPDKNELLLKGAVPGARGGLLVLSTPDGTLVVDMPEPPLEIQNQPESVVVSEPAQPVAAQ